MVTPAKINLFLGVGPLRADGYHELATVFQALDLTDELVARHEPSRIRLQVAAGGPKLPTGPANLAVRAARLLRERAGVTSGVAFELTKRIPVAGGMAGGSSDAAAALVACNALWGLKCTPGDLADVAAEVGSDVPFCLHGGTALGASRGEVLTPVLTSGTFTWVVATSFGSLSTPAVYGRLDEMRHDEVVPPPAVPTELLAALRSGDAGTLAGALGNDLQRPAVAMRPELDLLLESGRDFGALGAMVSGSGPTCVFLVADHEGALDLSVSLSGTGLCRTTLVASAPAPGARVVTG